MLGNKLYNFQIWSFAKINVAKSFRTRQSQKLMSQKTFEFFPSFAKISVAKINENEKFMQHQQCLDEDRDYSTCMLVEHYNEEDKMDDNSNDIYQMESEKEGDKNDNRNIFVIFDEIGEDDK